MIRFAAVVLWAAVAVCLWMALMQDRGAAFAIGYVVLQGASIAVTNRARKRAMD